MTLRQELHARLDDLLDGLGYSDSGNNNHPIVGSLAFEIKFSDGEIDLRVTERELERKIKRK